MSQEERTQRTIYHACTHAIKAVDDQLSRKSADRFRAALEMERQSYVDLANETAANVEGLAPVK